MPADLRAESHVDTAPEVATLIDQFGALARAVQTAAALARCLDLTRSYTAQREQFGRPLATQPIVQHELAGLAGESAAASAAAEAAVRAVAADQASPNGFPLSVSAARAIAVAKVRAGLSATAGARVAHQLHGAMGITREYELATHTRSLWAWRDEYGAERRWATWLADTLRGTGEALWPSLVPTPAPSTPLRREAQ